MRTIIIDDDKSSIKTLEKKLSLYPQVELCGNASTCSSGIHLSAEVNPEIIFLDVELPDMSGLEFLSQLDRTVRGWCQVVMYTGHKGYMLPPFRLNAFDFLLKPVDDRELKNVLNRIFHKKENDSGESPLHFTVNSIHKHNKMILYTNSADFRLVHTEDICTFQHNHKERAWEVVVAGHRDPIQLKRNANCESILEIDSRFIQVSQKYIINIDYLVEVVQNTCVFYPPFERVNYIKIGRMYRKKLIERFSAI